MDSEKVEEYAKRFQSFFAAKLCFTRKELQAEHIRLLKSLFFNDSVKLMHLLDHTKTQIDQIFLAFVQENDENLGRFESLKKRGEINCIRKFGEIEESLAVSIQENPLSFSFQITKEELQDFVDTSVEPLPGNWKGLLSSWYFEQIKEFWDDIEIVVSMINQYKENLDTQISSLHPTCAEAGDFQDIHDQCLAIAQKMDLNHPWKHRTLNQHAFRAIESIREIAVKDYTKPIEEEMELVV